MGSQPLLSWSHSHMNANKLTTQTRGAYTRLAEMSSYQDVKLNATRPATVVLRRLVFETHVTVKWGYDDKARCYVYSRHTAHRTADSTLNDHRTHTDWYSNMSVKSYYTTLLDANQTLMRFNYCCSVSPRQRSVTTYGTGRRRIVWTPANADATTAAVEREPWRRPRNIQRIGSITNEVPWSASWQSVGPTALLTEHLFPDYRPLDILRVSMNRSCFYHFTPCVVRRWHV